jgi:LuxR family transcriptional regulator of spore coat protein
MCVRFKFIAKGVLAAERENRNWSILTKREREIFEKLICDQTSSEIAASLNINEKTVRNHISNVIQKLNVRGRAQAVVELIRLNELQVDDSKKNEKKL